MLKTIFAVTLLLTVLSCSWLYLAYSNGNRTKNWTSVPAVVTENGAVTGSDIRGRRRGVKSWLTAIAYSVDGETYDAVIDDYLVGSEAVVFVNPDNPEEVVGKTGPKMEDTFYPLVATAFTVCLSVVILLIAFSPKDD